MKIADKNTFNFGAGVWTNGLLLLVNDCGQDKYCVVTRNEKIEVGDVYVMRLNRYDFELMNPVADKAEAERCNDRSSIGRNCYKLLVTQDQIVEDQMRLLRNLHSYVLIKLYPLMDGPGQSGWMIDNDVEGGTNKVILHMI